MRQSVRADAARAGARITAFRRTDVTKPLHHTITVIMMYASRHREREIIMTDPTKPKPDPTKPEPTAMKPKRFIARLAIALTLATAGLVASAAPASAAYSDCPPGTGCVFMNTLGGGNMLVFPVGTYGIGGCANLHSGFPSWAPDNIESLRAGYGSGLRLQVWKHSNCTGLSQTLSSVNQVSWGYHILLSNDGSSIKILHAA